MIAGRSSRRRRRLAAKIKSRRAQLGRGDPGPPGPDRRGRRRRTRLPARRRRSGAGHRGGGRREDRGRRAGRPAGRRAAGAEGRADLLRGADHLRLEDPGGLDPALRRDRDPAAARRRHRDLGQDQHGRVRDGLLDRELRVRADPQPVGPGPHPRRLRRRIVGRPGRVRGPAGHRHRHRRLDPAAGRGHRHGRGQADLRRHLPLRPGRAGLQPRPARAVRAYGAGRRPAAPGDRRPRPARLDLHRRAGARRGRRGPLRRRRRAEDRRGQGARAARATRPGSSSGSPRRSSLLACSARRSSRSPARTSSTPCRPTT